MKLRQLIGSLQSPNTAIIAEIITAVGQGMVLKRHKTIRLPNGSVQIWEHVAQRPPLHRDPIVTVVFVQGKAFKSWQRLEKTFDQALEHYERQRHLREQRVVDLKLRQMLELPPGIQADIPAMSTWRIAAGGES
ncbi:MAG: hypothetical protein KDK04_03295 [Candidatus Competibacteraceae bacterium]|nr:hypothetical protein [Candidatus Competibacteraceae bacterium]